MESSDQIHLEEQLLERFAIEPEAVTHEERLRIETHVRECDACAALLSFFSDIYNAYRSEPEPDPDRLERFLDELFPVPRVITLTPLGPSSYGSPQLAHAFGTVVSADTPTTAGKRFETVASLANRRERTLLRIVMDRGTGELKCYLLTDDPARRAHALISLDGDALQFLTDAAGKASVQSAQATAFTRAEVRYPSSRRELTILAGSEPVTGELGECSFTCTGYPPELRIRCGPESNVAGVGVIDKRTGAASFRPLRGAEVKIQLSGDARELLLLSYVH